jgi:hypothetical protein
MMRIHLRRALLLSPVVLGLVAFAGVWLANTVPAAAQSPTQNCTYDFGCPGIKAGLGIPVTVPPMPTSCSNPGANCTLKYSAEVCCAEATQQWDVEVCEEVNGQPANCWTLPNKLVTYLGAWAWGQDPCGAPHQFPNNTVVFRLKVPSDCTLRRGCVEWVECQTGLASPGFPSDRVRVELD